MRSPRTTPRSRSPLNSHGTTTLLKPGDVVVVDFSGVTGIKRSPAVIVSFDAYHSTRPDVILGLISSQVAGSIGSTDHALADWSSAALRVRAPGLRCAHLRLMHYREESATRTRGRREQ